jgi:hypothetical protein
MSGPHRQSTPRDEVPPPISPREEPTMADRIRDRETTSMYDGFTRGSSAWTSSWRPGVLETLTASHGPVPRILLRDVGPESPITRPASEEIPSPPDAAGRYQLFG